MTRAEHQATEIKPLMVIDDDAAVRETIEEVVRAEGYPVVTATNGMVALNRLRSGLRPGVILLDLRMPVMDGRTFRELQVRDPLLSGIPVILISGDLDACRAAARAGADFLLKPFELEQLLSVAKRFCGNPLDSDSSKSSWT